jgi:hypothetical protein
MSERGWLIGAVHKYMRDTNLVFERSFAVLSELGLNSVRYTLCNCFLFQKMNFTFGRMHINVNRRRVKLYAVEMCRLIIKITGKRKLPEVDEWRTTFGKNAGVAGLQRFLDT